MLESNWAPGAHGTTRTSGSANGIAGTGMLVEVLGDVCHGDRVEADSTCEAATEGVEIPGLNVLLLVLGQTGELDRSSVLVSKVHGRLHHVTRAAAVVSARTVAVFGASRVSTRRIETSATSGVHGALELRDVVRTRKGLLGASEANLVHYLGFSEGDDKTRAAEWSLLHDRRVAELLNKRLASLDCRVRDLGGLVGVETGPEATLDAIDEHEHTVRIGKVDEGVANVAAGLEINPQIYEIVGAEAGDVDHVLQSHLSKKLVKVHDVHGRRDVPNRVCSECCEASP